MTIGLLKTNVWVQKTKRTLRYLVFWVACVCTFGGVMVLSAVSVGDGNLSIDETVLIPSISSSFCVQSYGVFLKRK